VKRSVLVIVLVVLAGVLVAIIGSSVSGSDDRMKALPAIIPASLDQHYPPQSPAPRYWLAMLGLSKPFSGMVGDVQEGDLENAQLNFERFKKLYEEVSALVPEWSGSYPAEPVERLGLALASGDPSGIMPAVQAMGAVCHSCHLGFMAPVQQKYRWPHFGDISLTDPVSGQEVGYAQLMLMMETNFSGIDNDLAQGQTENAARQFAAFSARFKEFGDGCMICHETERQHYVSGDITSQISNLQSELGRPEIDREKVGGLLKSIGQESCAKCHLVHIPAAYAQQAGQVH